MSENERLREVLKRVSGELHYQTTPRGINHYSICKITVIIDKALYAEPDTCMWNSREDYTYTRSCDGRHTALMPGSYLDGSDFQTDELCPGCGRKIEVIK